MTYKIKLTKYLHENNFVLKITPSEIITYKLNTIETLIIYERNILIS